MHKDFGCCGQVCLHCALEDLHEILDSNFQANGISRWMRYLLWSCPQVIVIKPHWWIVNSGSGNNGLVWSGNKPLTEPCNGIVDPDLCLHMASLGHNELTCLIFAMHLPFSFAYSSLMAKLDWIITRKPHSTTRGWVESWKSGIGAQDRNIWRAGGRLNKKDGLTRYGNSHVKDKTS